MEFPTTQDALSAASRWGIGGSLWCVGAKALSTFKPKYNGKIMES